MISLNSIITFFGIISIIKLIFRVFSFIRTYFFSRPINFKEKYGNGWVVVTGASEGIGFGFAEQFARLNHKVLLISRNEEKLKKAVNELNTKYPNAIIKYEIFDFNRDYNEEDINSLKKILSTYIKEEICILFNNVGTFEGGYLSKMKDEGINKVINVNAKASVFVSKIVIEHMRQRNQRSLIVGSGSVDAVMKYQRTSIYSCTKSFLKTLFSVLSKENEDKIDFTLLTIGPVKTSMNKENYIFLMNVKDFTKACLNVIGQYKIVSGYFTHQLIIIVYKLVPTFIKKMIINYAMSVENKHKKPKQKKQ